MTIKEELEDSKKMKDLAIELINRPQDLNQIATDLLSLSNTLYKAAMVNAPKELIIAKLIEVYEEWVQQKTSDKNIEDSFSKLDKI